MTKVVIFGNSGSGKSTLARKFKTSKSLAHLDLDTVAWLPTNPPTRMAVCDSQSQINEFINGNDSWVIEGCYADLIELILPYADQIFFLNLPIVDCIENARKRPWEPHKYDSKEAQDANLAMLIDWIEQYDQRNDSFSKQAHELLFDTFQGEKTMLTSNT